MTSEPTFEPTLEPTVEPTFEPTFKPTIDPSSIITIGGSKGSSLVDRLTGDRVLASFAAGGAFLMVLTVLGWQRCGRKCTSTKENAETGTPNPSGDLEDLDGFDDDGMDNLSAPLPSADEGKKKYDLSLPTNIFSAIQHGRYPKKEEAPPADEETPSTPPEPSHDAKDDPVAPVQNKKYDLSLPTRIFSAIQLGKYPKRTDKKEEEEEEEEEEESKGDTPTPVEPGNVEEHFVNNPSYPPEQSSISSQDDDHMSYADENEEDKDSLISEDDESYSEYVDIDQFITGLVTSVKGSTTKVMPNQERIKQRSFVLPTTIKNNAEWEVKDAEARQLQESLVLASLGGHISKFDNDDYYYWVGTDPRKDDSSNRIYRSTTMGSGTWEYVTTVESRVRNSDDVPRVKPPNHNTLVGKVQGSRNCTLLYCKAGGYYVIYTKGIGIYKSGQINGNWKWCSADKKDHPGDPEIVGKLDEAVLFQKLNEKRRNHQLPELEPSHYHAGGMSAFCKDDRAHLIISVRHHSEFDTDGSVKHKSGKDQMRYVLIVKMTEDFMEVDDIVLWKNLLKPQREAMWLFKKDNLYYMTYDGPGGWEGSDCYYRTATRIGPWIEDIDPVDETLFHDEAEIGFVPDPKERKTPNSTKIRKDLRSFASQHRYIMKHETYDQWIYGGDRYPHHEPESHKLSHGLHIMCPLKWDGDKPVVYWKEEWDIAGYSTNESSDELDFRDEEFEAAQTLKKNRKRMDKRNKGRTAVGIRADGGVVLAVVKAPIDNEDALYSLEENENEDLAYTLAGKNESQEELATNAIFADDEELDANPLSLLVADVDGNNNTPRLHHVDVSGEKSVWTAAAIGDKAREATEILTEKYGKDVTSPSSDLDTAVVNALLALKNTLDKAPATTPNDDDTILITDMTVENVEVGVIKVDTGKFEKISGTDLEQILTDIA